MTADPNKPSEDAQEESLAQRSARLEAEASQIGQPSDPLAPEPAPQAAEESQPTPEIQEASTATPADNAEVAELQTQLAETKDQLLRALSEADNTRKRAQKEREEASKFAITNFARDLLSVSDNLRRALEAVTPDMLEAEPRIKNLTEGVEATERELVRSLEKNGIEKIEPGEEPFDPNMHEVMFETPGTGKPAGTIVEVMETGYSINGRLLRPARVGVAKDDGQAGGEPPEQPPPADSGQNLDTEA